METIARRQKGSSMGGVGSFALGVAAALVALIPVGRWERSRRARDQVAGMRGVVAAVGPLDSRSLDAFRHFQQFDCLLYKRGRNPFALELCVDPAGRVIETIDRRGSGDPKIWSLRDDPTRSTLRVDRAEVDRLLRKMEAGRAP
jgi:hypothetical protein